MTLLTVLVVQVHSYVLTRPSLIIKEDEREAAAAAWPY